uniref:Uncharacterized protein n=1 Tax=Ditylenchus dipsaci TaxID=166011 RepID=A0A915CN14_9BILA
MCFIGYAIYFDYKRRSAKGYKARLRVKRKVQFGQLDKESAVFPSRSSVREEKLLEGFVEEGIQHLAMAIVMCNRPEQVISIFRQTLADEHFALLNLAVPTARQRLAKLAEHQANSRSRDGQH